jgi:hypothetical protein
MDAAFLARMVSRVQPEAVVFRLLSHDAIFKQGTSSDSPRHSGAYGFAGSIRPCFADFPIRLLRDQEEVQEKVHRL